jgi:DNA-binding GntR family transcriptional regulator
MSEVTHILSAIEQGDPHAAAQFLPDHTQVVAARCHDSARRSEPPK